MKKFICTAIASLLLLSGCSQRPPQGNDEAPSDPGISEPSAVALPEVSDPDMFTERDLDPSFQADNCVTVRLDGNTATSSSDSVLINGSTVTITEGADYYVTGELEGMLAVSIDEGDKARLILDGVIVNNPTGAALYVIEGDKVFVTLANGSDNTLSNGGEFVPVDENNVDGAVFSKQDLTINGSGSLTVTSKAGHGIVAKDDLVLAGGELNISCASHAIDANDSVRIKDAHVTAYSGKDGIHSENSDDASLGFVYISGGSITAEAEGDGISAGAYVSIEGGELDIVTGGGSVNAEKQSSDNWGSFMPGGMGGHGGMGSPGGKVPGGTGGAIQPPSLQKESGTYTDGTAENSTSIKGIKATGHILISGGSFCIDSADDAVHSNASITVNGGDFKIATGDDGFHADDTLTVTSGTIEITKSYEGLEALHIIVSGGDVSLVASDDGLNAAGGTDQSGTGGLRGGDRFSKPGGMSTSSNGSITVSGGALSITASGDGIDANGKITVSGGYTVVTGPTQGDTATLDYDTEAVITGGTFIGTGASNMAQSFSACEQGVIALSVGNQGAGTEISVTNKSGDEIISHSPALSYQVIILSSPELVCKETYSVSVGSYTGEFTAE